MICGPEKGAQHCSHFRSVNGLLWANKRPCAHWSLFRHDNCPCRQSFLLTFRIVTGAICEHMPCLASRWKMKLPCTIWQCCQCFSCQKAPRVVWHKPRQSKTLGQILPHTKKCLVLGPQVIVRATTGVAMLFCVRHMAATTLSRFPRVKMTDGMIGKESSFPNDHELFDFRRGMPSILTRGK